MGEKEGVDSFKMAYLKLLCFLFPLFFTPTFTQMVTLPLQYVCSGEYGNYSENSPYRKNLNLLLSSFPTSPSYGFYNLSTGEVTNRVNSIILCRGDVTWESCRKCFKDAASMLPKLCRYQKEAITWYDDCMLRYSSRTIYGKPETKPYHYIENPNLAPDLNQFSSVLGNLMSSLLEEAGSGGSLKKFAIGKVNFTESQDIYGLFQCTPDISKSDCVFCLNASIKLFDACCTGQTGGRIFMPSCTVRYEMFQFYSNTGLVLPSTPVSLPPPTAGAPPGQETDTAKGKKRNTLRIVIIVVPTIAFTCIVVAACLCMRMKKARRKAKNAAEIALTDSLCFDFETIRSSTNNFSDASKLGQGGFGAVYKGTLPSGQEIAVKRLFKNSEQGEREFKNEVSLMAKLQHRNLVRLLGYCIHRQERLLVLEFLQKGSLSNFIFVDIWTQSM